MTTSANSLVYSSFSLEDTSVCQAGSPRILHLPSLFHCHGQLASPDLEPLLFVTTTSQYQWPCIIVIPWSVQTSSITVRSDDLEEILGSDQTSLITIRSDDPLLKTLAYHRAVLMASVRRTTCCATTVRQRMALGQSASTTRGLKDFLQAKLEITDMAHAARPCPGDVMYCSPKAKYLLL